MAGELVLPEGRVLAAQLRGLDEQGRFLFEAGSQSLRLTIDQFVRFGGVPEVTRGPVVVLRSGGMVCADVIEADDATIVVLSDLFGIRRLDRQAVAGILFSLPGDPVRMDRELDRCGLLSLDTSPKNEEDLVWLLNGDEIRGRIRGVTDRRLQVETEFGEIETARNQVQGLRFAVDHPEDDNVACVVGFEDGSVLQAVSCARGNEEELVLRDPRGKTWQASISRIRFIQTFSARWSYLSDSEIEYRHVPFFSVVLSERRDRNIVGGRLRAGGITYWKGLGVYSACRLTYRVREGDRLFAGQVAIDDSTGGAGSVGVRIYVDGKPAVDLGIIRGGDEPHPVAVSLDGVSRLDLLVDFGERADELDRVDWLDARIVR
ncbi:hypothetical protein JCM19992_15290 [Thermostilla marina]